MSSNTQIVLVLSLVALSVVSLADNHSNLNHEEILRFRRKIGQYEGLGPKEYMEQLRKSMSTSSGVPVDIDNTPTSVWGLLDTDIVDEKYHPKPINKQCKLKQKFRFNLTTLAKENSEQLPLSLAKMRTYVQPINRFLPKNNKSIDVEVSIYTRRTSSINKTLCSGSYMALDKQIITVDSTFESQWIEWNVTEGLVDCWGNSSSSEMDIFEVTFVFQLVEDCVAGYKKLPIVIVDPATIPLEQTVRRDRHWPLQPMMILFLDSEEVRREIKDSIKEAKPNYPIFSTTDETRSKRSSSNSLCELKNMTVKFADLNLHHILLPLQYNAYQCEGMCSNAYINKSPSSNHAKVLAAMHYYNSNGLIYAKPPPRNPSCVAIQHLPLTVVEITPEKSIVTRHYPNMVATSCECRA